MDERHTIIRQAISEGAKMRHIIECTCGRKIANTTSLTVADRKAGYHLEVANAG